MILGRSCVAVWTCHVTTSVHHREATFVLELDLPLACHDHNARPPLDSPLDSIYYLKVSACSPLSTMSRRESRTSMNERQSDALFEFENCLYRALFRNLTCLLTTSRLILQSRRSSSLPISISQSPSMSHFGTLHVLIAPSGLIQHSASE